MKTGTIHYGFGAEYLPDWGIQEALREIYQNFLDYGDYEEEVIRTDEKVTVKLINGWVPESLEYLRIGNTNKDSDRGSIGHHGEGLKMAFLILLRESFWSRIFTNKYAVYPEFYTDAEIGDCFCFNYEIHEIYEAPYTVEFECNPAEFDRFKENLIQPSDILFSHWDYGDLVNKPAGNIYSGGLFVANLKNVSRAYNIKPRYLPLDRDRRVPQAFDINYRTSKILEASEAMTVKDLSYSDTTYVSSLPKTLYSAVKPRKVGSNIEFTIKDETGKENIITNSSLKEHLTTHSLFQKAIMRLKKFLAKKLGVYELLVEFREKHLKYQPDALQDFNVILERIEEK